MMPMRIDFGRRTVRRALAYTSWMTWLSGAAACVLCATVGVQAWSMYTKTSKQTVELQRLQAQLAQRRARQVVTPAWTVPADQATAVNLAIAQLNLPWRDVLDSIEAATPSSIALLSLEPDAKKRRLRVLAEAKTSDAMIDYVEELKQQAFFDGVVLIKHEINEQDPNKPIRFQFEAQWLDAAP